VLAVWRLDRLGRSLTQLIALMTTLDEKGVGFKSLTEQIDTTTSGGKLIFHIFGALAEFERNLIRERTRAGLAAARARGRQGGRPKTTALDTPRKIQLAQKMYDDPENTIEDICRAMGVSRATLYRYITPSSRKAVREVERA
jgi:DNA invertase Pin-like site-specific DNA recombinase